MSDEPKSGALAFFAIAGGIAAGALVFWFFLFVLLVLAAVGDASNSVTDLLAVGGCILGTVAAGVIGAMFAVAQLPDRDSDDEPSETEEGK